MFLARRSFLAGLFRAGGHRVEPARPRVARRESGPAWTSALAHYGRPPLCDALLFAGFELPVAGFERLIEQHAYFSRARRQRMREVGAHQPRLAFIPARHGSFAAHGLKRVEERAAHLRRDLTLDFHQARERGNGGDAASWSRVARDPWGS